MNKTAAIDREVHISRLFDAPRELVFQAWSDPAHLECWFAPNGCAVSFRKLDFRVGGTFHSCIRTPDGHECWCVGEYREIAAPSRIAFTMAVADAAGNRSDPVAMGMDPAWPAETLVTVTFADEQGKTRLTLDQTVSESLARKTGAYPSWLQMFDRLADKLATTAAVG